MLQIYDEFEHVGFDQEGREIIRAELSGASVSELPQSKYVINGKVLYEGSRFWDISTGDQYGMTDDGSWHKQSVNKIIW